MPKRKFVACSVVVKETRDVSQTDRASTEEPKNKVEGAIHEECPNSVEKVSEQIRYLHEPRQCLDWSEGKTEESITCGRARYGASKLHVRAD